MVENEAFNVSIQNIYSQCLDNPVNFRLRVIFLLIYIKYVLHLLNISVTLLKKLGYIIQYFVTNHPCILSRNKC
jgi:hypothetical protein